MISSVGLCTDILDNLLASCIVTTMDFDKILRNILIAGIFLVPFIPYIVSNNMFFPFITGKNFAFRIITEILLGTWILLAIRNVAYRPNFSWILITFAAFVGIIAVADFSGVNAAKSIWSNFERMEGLVTLVHLLAYLVVAGTVLKTEKLWRYFFHVSIGVSIFAVIFGFFQLDGITQINQGGVRVDARFGNATYLAVYMLFHVFITAMYLFRDSKSIKPLVVSGVTGFAVFIFYIVNVFMQQLPQGTPLPDGVSKYLWICVLGIMGLSYLYFQHSKEYVNRYVVPALYTIIILSQLFILYYTATRGSILGVLGGTLLAAILIAILEKERVLLRRVGVGMLAGVLLVVGGFFSIKDSDFAKSSPVLARFTDISVESGTVQARFTIWNMALQGVKERPILGWGQENFNLVFNKYYNPVLYNDEPWFDRTHNIFFDWLIAGGILGLLAYLSIPLTLLYYIWFGRGKTLSVVDKSLLTGLLSGYMFHNLFVFDNIMSYIMYTSILAYVYAATTEDVKEGKMAKTFDVGVVNRVATPIVILALVFTIYAVNAKPILASQTLINALRNASNGELSIRYFKEALAYESFANQEIREQLIQASMRTTRSNAEPGIKQQLFDLSKAEMQKQRAIAPDDARHALFMGSLLESGGQVNEATSHFEDAMKYSPNKQTIRFALVGNLLNAGRIDEAQALMKETIELEPNFDESHVMYAITAIYAKDLEKADQIIFDFFGQEVIDNGRLLQTYINTNNWQRVIDINLLRVENDPTNAQQRITLAASYLQLDRRAEAIEQIEKAIELSPDLKEQGEFLIQEINAGRNP